MDSVKIRQLKHFVQTESAIQMLHMYCYLIEWILPIIPYCYQNRGLGGLASVRSLNQQCKLMAVKRMIVFGYISDCLPALQEEGFNAFSNFPYISLKIHMWIPAIGIKLSRWSGLEKEGRLFIVRGHKVCGLFLAYHLLQLLLRRITPGKACKSYCYFYHLCFMLTSPKAALKSHGRLYKIHKHRFSVE